MNAQLLQDVRDVESLKNHVALRAMECERTEREMWRAISRIADAYQSLVCEMDLLRRWLFWVVVAACISALCSLIGVGVLVCVLWK